MKKETEEALKNNKIIAEILSSCKKEELHLLRTYISLGVVDLFTNEKHSFKEPLVRIIKLCAVEKYNVLDYMLSFICGVDLSKVSTKTKYTTNPHELCNSCNVGSCIKRFVPIFCHEVDLINGEQNQNDNVTWLEAFDFLIGRIPPKFSEVPTAKFFSNVDLIDLMYVRIILDGDFVNLEKIDEETGEVEANYLDLTEKHDEYYYVNDIVAFYKNHKYSDKITININDFSSIKKEKKRWLRIYKIAAYYKYLIEYKRIDVIKRLREVVEPRKVNDNIKNRSRYFIHRYFSKVEELPYSKGTKNKIYNILYYILNYSFNYNTPFIPLNLLVYSSDKEGVRQVVDIIGEFMWYFGYLSEDMGYYDVYLNNVILDKYQVKRVYYTDEKVKNGVIMLHNFDNLLFIDSMKRDLILNILADEMDTHNNKTCTVIYGEKKDVDKILENHPKMTENLLNLELEIDNLEIKDIYDLERQKLEKLGSLSDDVKTKLNNYIKSTYNQSNVKNFDYVNKLYNSIVLKANEKFEMGKRAEFSVDSVPDAYNTQDLPTIMKNFNDLVGLEDIKEQINDLVYLLKFNKKANINIRDFNLHMVFRGNPGTGKTTVGRLLTDIFYYLGYIKNNKLVEVTSKDLIAEYLGQTAGKTYNVVNSALGGVLFIDEAYSITQGKGEASTYGDECIATLLKVMEDYRDKLIIIFAGYKEEMDEFEKANPGLYSRIGYNIDFPDFTIDELVKIYTNLLEVNNLKITDEALEKLRDIVDSASKGKNFGNGRYIHNIFQKILIEHAKNIETGHKVKDSNIMLIEEKDIVREKLIVKEEPKIGF